jgi:hypothetical protein
MLATKRGAEAEANMAALLILQFCNDTPERRQLQMICNV